MKKQIAINLVNNLSCTIRANDGVHCAYNILDSPSRFRQSAFAVVLPLTTPTNVRFLYKLPHGFFKGKAFKRIAPTVNASAFAEDNLFTWIEPKR